MLAAWCCPVTTVVIGGTRTLGVKHLGVVVEEDGVLVSVGWGERLLQQQFHEVAHKDRLEQTTVAAVALILEDVVVLVDKVGDAVCRRLVLPGRGNAAPW